MDANVARQFILDNISVTRQKVVFAKGYIIQNFNPKSELLINGLLRHMDAQLPDRVLLHSSVDPLPQLRQVAESFSWRLAACEAIWGLVHSNAVLPNSTQLSGGMPHLPWTTVMQNSGGTSSGWSFEALSIMVPADLALPPSHQTTAPQPLVDPDLYLHELNIPNLHPEIELALREAVKCLKYDLYTACLGMLGLASEIAWTELGLALAHLVASEPAAATVSARVLRDMSSPFVGIGKRIEDVVDLYGHQDWVQPLPELSDVKLQDLRSSRMWADAVRDGRNSLHYGATPAMSNSYEKVAVLMISAVPHLKNLWKLKEAADEMIASRGAATTGSQQIT